LKAFAELERVVYAALETYSNVHLGRRQSAYADGRTLILPQKNVKQQMNDFVRAAAQRVYTQLQEIKQ
jgi:hypothetical protein